MKVKKWLKSTLSMGLAFCITMGSLLGASAGRESTIITKADTSAKSRVQTFIGLAAGKSGNALPDIGQMTQDELQFLGVYLSNFYVPFSTELGLTTDSDSLKAQKEQMVQALKVNLNFNETVCSELVDNIIGLSRSNCYELKYGFVSDLSETPTSWWSATYWDFVNFMFGVESFKEGKISSVSDLMYRRIPYFVKVYDGVDLTFDNSIGQATHLGYKTNVIKGNVFNESEGKKYIKFGFIDSSNTFVSVFDASLYRHDSDGNLASGFSITSSQAAFFQCLLSVDTNMGYGLNFFDIYNSDVTETGEKLLSMLNRSLNDTSEDSFTEDDIFSLSAYGNKVYVDCFGNIFRSSPAHQTIVVPGCMNPYTWVSVGSDGYDVEDSGLKSYMSVNLPSINSISDNTLCSEIDMTGSVSKINLSRSYFSLDKKFYLEERLKNYLVPSDFSISYTDESSSPFSFSLDDGSTVELRYKLIQLKEGYGLNYMQDSHIIGSVYLTGYEWNLMAGDSTREITANNRFLWINNSTASAKLLGIVTKKAKEKNISAWLSWDSKAFLRSGSGVWSSTETCEESVIGGRLLSPSRTNVAVSENSYTPEEDISISNGNYSAEYLPLKNMKVQCLDRMCFIDDLNAFGFDSSNSDVAYDTIQFNSILSSSGLNSAYSYLNGVSNSSSSTYGFGNVFSESSRGVIRVCDITSELATSLYTTYAIAGLYDESSKESTIGKLGYRINREGLPQITSKPLLLSGSSADEQTKKDLLNMLYYLLKPDAVDYIKIALKNKLQAILVDWHNDMVGTSGTGATLGTTYYRTNYGYVTTPDLSEIQWTSSLIDLYNSFIPLLVVFMVLSMLLSFVTGVMSLQKAAAGVIVFSVFLLVPVNALNLVVSRSNAFTNRIYGDKFIYWALVQEQTFGTAIDTAATGNSYENYLKTLYSTNAANQGGESIILKWQAPKKMASLMLSNNDKNLLDSLKGGLLTSRFLNNTSSKETYLDGDNQYLYRDYSDLANFSRYIYKSIKDKVRYTTGTPGSTNLSSYMGDPKYLNDITMSDGAYKTAVANGYINAPSDWSNNFVLSKTFSEIYLKVTDPSIIPTIKSGTLSKDTYLGINQDMFNTSIAYFNKKTDSEGSALSYINVIKNMAQSGNLEGNQSVTEWYEGKWTGGVGANSESDWNSLMLYGLLSESPYYYYSWGMYDDKMSVSPNATGGYRSMILGREDESFFYNLEGNGELKDFMNMQTLFKTVIPVLKRGNDIVRAFDERYGIFLYDGVPTDEGYLNDYTIQNDSNLKYKYWHNLNVARLYEIYTPWVDLMYDCSYAKGCYVRALGEKYWVEDPLDPYSYPDVRPMVFSESEMVDYGLSEGDLTEVERKILKFNKEAQKDMYELLNYYNFTDLSLNTAAAMECTFIFNNIFSENGLFSNNINLYPQNFEIKDFSYDAFLRFILSTTTGDSMSATDDFYGDLVKKSSTTTAIMLLVCDVLSQYVMPFVKIVFLIAVFIASILLIMVTVFRVDPEFKFVGKIGKDIFLPLIEFFILTVGFAYVISLFMGVGNNSVTQTAEVSISLGDPNMVLVAICVVDVVCVVLYVLLLMRLWNSIKTNASLVKTQVSGLVGGVVSMGVSAFKNATSGVGGGSGGSIGSEGATGVESARATSRANRRKSDLAESEDRGRSDGFRHGNNRRSTMNTQEGKSDEKRSAAINEVINKGKTKVNSEKK